MRIQGKRQQRRAPAMKQNEQLANSLPSTALWAMRAVCRCRKNWRARSGGEATPLSIWSCSCAQRRWPWRGNWSVADFGRITVIPLGVLGTDRRHRPPAPAWTARRLFPGWRCSPLSVPCRRKRTPFCCGIRAAKVAGRVLSLTRAALRAAAIEHTPASDVILDLAGVLSRGLRRWPVATGAGASNRVAIGTGIVIGGTLAATLLGDLLRSLILCTGETSVLR